MLSAGSRLQGLNPDVRYEVQYSSYVNVTPDGFVVLKRAVKTESFALQVTKALSSGTGRGRKLKLSFCAAPSRGRHHGRVRDGGALRSGLTG